MCHQHDFYAELVLQGQLDLIEIDWASTSFHRKFHASPKVQFFYRAIEILGDLGDEFYFWESESGAIATVCHGYQFDIVLASSPFRSAIAL